ncbi:MAG: hypothetical protein ACYCZZ_02145 [Minisyncoccota bacterium]
MSKKPFAGVLAMLLTITLVAPAAFFVAPQRAAASSGGVGCVGGIIGGLLSTAGAAVAVPNNSAFENVTTNMSAGATLGSCINDVILIPLARAAIRAILQKMTASVINWINGGNGTGQPSYIQNLSVHLQGVADAVTLPFISQFATAFNSPFGLAISSSLQGNYAQLTSMAGFYAANQCTLAAASPNVPAYLAGNWSQGGVAAWFALTTQTQNNPYTLYQKAQDQITSNINQAQTNRRQDLIESSGFLSWCGGNSSSASGYSVGSSGVSPSSPCINPDGTTAPVLTPGSVIHDYTQKAVVASGFDQLISATDLDNALGAIVSALLTQVLGGSGGLFGGSSSSGLGAPAVTSQLQNYSSNNTSASGSAVSLAQSILARANSYISAWQTIGAAAQAASASVTDLANFCTTAAQNSSDSYFVNAANAQAAAAQTALTTEIAPILNQANAAPGAVAATKSFAQKVEAEAVSASSVNTVNSASGLSADLATLMAMPPSIIDVTNAQQNAQAAGGATASPPGSLTVSPTSSTIVDQMNLISANAQALKASACTPSASYYGYSNYGG